MIEQHEQKLINNLEIFKHVTADQNQKSVRARIKLLSDFHQLTYYKINGR